MAHARLSGQGDFALGFLYSEGGKIRVGVGFFKFQKPLGRHELCGIFLLLGDHPTLSNSSVSDGSVLPTEFRAAESLCQAGALGCREGWVQGTDPLTSCSINPLALGQLLAQSDSQDDRPNELEAGTKARGRWGR